MTDQQQIIDDSDLRKYRTELPNMADDELGPFEYRLYAHYKRVCGNADGLCWESIRTTAARTGMSHQQVNDIQHDLASEGWIEIFADDVSQSVIITIVDRWLENFMRFTPTEKLERLIANRQHSRQLGTENRQPGGQKNDHDQSFNSSVVGSSDSDSETTTDKTSPTTDLQLLELARADARTPFTIWEDEGFGTLTPFTGDRLGDWIDTFGEESVKVALLSAVMNDVRKPSYIDAALKRMFGERTSREVREEAARRKGWEQAAEQSERDEALRVSLYAPTPRPAHAAPPVLMADGRNPHTVWESAYGQLQLQMPKEAFDTWLRGVKLMRFEGADGIGVFTLGVANVHAQAWLEHRLMKPILRTLSQVAGSAVVVKFVLMNEFAEKESLS